ncbi:MAG: hypothetical protein ACREPZ_06940 [Rhodanobacteraceae bacterium]
MALFLCAGAVRSRKSDVDAGSRSRKSATDVLARAWNCAGSTADTKANANDSQYEYDAGQGDLADAVLRSRASVLAAKKNAALVCGV